MMRVNIYYGGRGLIEDPTIYVMNKITEVLEELRVEVNRYNLYENKQGISVLTKTLKECDGVILAANVEWMGIGGLMQQFLDACWLYADKEYISQLYMMPVVMATTYGEKDAELTLIKAWEMLGGIPASGLCAYVENHIEFETNPDYMLLIEKSAEMLYRTISQKIKTFPSSTSAVKQGVLKTESIDLTPQESEQLSVYVSDDTYVKQQKEDIEELTQFFKGMLGPKETTGQDFIKELKDCFVPQRDFSIIYAITFTDKNDTLVIDIKDDTLNCYYGSTDSANVVAKMTREIMRNITDGRMTFQRAFMSGEITAKGDFKTLRTFDSVFPFQQ